MRYHGIGQITVKSLFSPIYKLNQQTLYWKNSLSSSKKQYKIPQRNKDKREKHEDAPRRYYNTLDPGHKVRRTDFNI